MKHEKKEIDELEYLLLKFRFEEIPINKIIGILGINRNRYYYLRRKGQIQNLRKEVMNDYEREHKKIS